MAPQRFNLQDFLVRLIKFVCGVAIALFVISLAGVATARYFLTQLSTLPERPVYDNDTPAQTETVSSASPNPAPQPAAETAAEASPAQQADSAADDAKALYKVVVTYGAGLLVRTGAGADYETIDGIDFDQTVDVLEESGRWYKIRTSSGVEGWIKGPGNTQRL